MDQNIKTIEKQIPSSGALLPEALRETCSNYRNEKELPSTCFFSALFLLNAMVNSSQK